MTARQGPNNSLPQHSLANVTGSDQCYREPLLKSLQRVKGTTAVVVRFGIVRPQRQRVVVARDRLLETSQFMQGSAAITEHLGIIWLCRKSAVVARQSGVKPLQLI